MTFFEPGTYDIPAADYHADPALGHSGAVTIMDCPARFHYELTAERENKKEFDIGTATHLLVLERDKFAAGIVEIDEENYRKKSAQEERDYAWSIGKTPLLPSHMQQVEAMRAAIMRHPFCGQLFTAGVAEQSLFWRDRRHGIMRKARLDYRVDDQPVDVKTVASAHPFAAARAAYKNHWWSQEAWYREAVKAALGKASRGMIFVIVEQKPPHLVVPYYLEPSAVAWGDMHNAAACERFATCCREDRWPGYGDEPRLINLPSFSEFELERRLADNDFRTKPTPEEIARGNALFSR